MLEKNPNDLDRSENNKKTYVYNTEDDTWKNFGSVPEFPLVSHLNDGLVYPDLYERIIEVKNRKQANSLNNLKLTPQKPYFYLFYSSDNFVTFIIEGDKLRIEVNRGAVLRRLFRSPCIGPRGRTGAEGKKGRDGVPAPNEKFRPVYQDGSFDLEVATPNGDETPISIRGFTTFEQKFEALLFANGTTEDPDDGLQEVEIIGDFNDGKVTIKGILNDPNLRFKIRQQGAQGAPGPNGVNYVQVFTDDATTNGQFTEIVGMLRYNSRLNRLIFKKTSVDELINNTLNMTPSPNLPNGDNWVAAEITSDPRKDIEYHRFDPDLSAPTLDLPSYVPLSGCYNQRRYALGYLQEIEGTPFTFVTDAFPDYKSCKDPYWFCGNSNTDPCDGRIEVDPSRLQPFFETSSSSSSSDSSSSDGSSSSESTSESSSSESSELSSLSSSESSNSDSSDSDLSNSSDSHSSNSSDGDHSSNSSDGDYSSNSSDGDPSSSSSDDPSSDSSNEEACVSTVTWTQNGSPGTCSLNNYKVIGGVPTITLYFNSCSSVYATYTYSDGSWSVTGYPTICPITITNVRSNNLFCESGDPDIELNICLESPCEDCGNSDIIIVP